VLQDEEGRITLDIVLSCEGLLLGVNHTKLKSFIEVGAESSEHDGSLLLVGEEDDFGLAYVVRLKHVVVGLSNVDYSISNELESSLLELICVELVCSVNDIDVRNRARWVHSVRWVLGDSFFAADLLPLRALN